MIRSFSARLLSASLALALAVMPLHAANIPLLTGPQDPSQLNATINGVINNINAGITPNSTATFSNFRNYVDNGAMQIQQRGTGVVTCGTTTIPPTTAYGADRWGCNANVTSGAGRMQPVTSGPTPPVGFGSSQILYRTSGALTQPVCAWQEIGSDSAKQLAGQGVVFSANLQALAGLAADNGAVANLVIVTGTGNNEGLQSFTASPAITPAWTGIATLQTTPFTLTTAWARYAAPAVIVPAATTEIGVAICFTPTATGAGATDGLAFVGVQLEQGASASTYEFRPLPIERELAQRFAFVLTEAAAGVVQVGGGSAQGTTTTCTAMIPFPTTMRIAPTYTNTLSATTFKLVSASQTATALSTPFSATLVANTPDGASVNFTTTGMTAKDGCALVGAGGTGSMLFTADF